MKITITSHLGIYAIILKNNAILLIKKSRGPYTGKLDLPGGRPEHGETPLQTVVREVLEETGLVLHKADIFDNYATVAQRHFYAEGIQENMHHLGMIYRATDYDDEKLILDMDAEDSLGAQWYPLDSLIKNDLSPFAWYAVTAIKKLNA